jgi:hypothetical protein
MRILPNREQDPGVNFISSKQSGEDELVMIVTRSNNADTALNIFSNLYPDISVKASSVFEKDLYSWTSVKYIVIE